VTGATGATGATGVGSAARAANAAGASAGRGSAAVAALVDAKREFYRRTEVAARYERQRFGGASGAWVDRREQRLALSHLPASCLVLDAGCGTGRLLPVLARRAGPGGRVLGVDASLPMLAVAGARLARGADRPDHGQRVTLSQADAFTLPLAAGACDAVVSLRFLFHFADPAPLLRELRRVTRTGGALVCDTAAWSPRSLVPLDARRWGARVSTIGRARFAALAEAAGWRVRAAQPAFFLTPHVYRLLPVSAARALAALEAALPPSLLCRVYWTLEAV
jgi:SAM-dependent methyltransferase